MLKSKTLITHCLLLVLNFIVTPALADIEVTLNDPDWSFLLHNQLPAQTDAQLASNESSFARQIQPLLAAQDHGAILKAFASRDIANDSAALRQLRGQVLLSLKRYKEAEQALLAALQLMPDLALAHRSLSMAYMIEKRYRPAREHLRRSIELGVADAQVYGQLAFVNLQLGQAASAIAGYQTALFMDADNDQWRQGLLFALINSQAFDQAQALLDEMLQDNPQNADLWLQRGQIALKQERPLQALGSMEAALALGEKQVENIITTAQLHIQSGSPRRAVDLLSDNITQLVGRGAHGDRHNDAGNNAKNPSRIEVIDQISAWLAFQQDWEGLGQLMRALDNSKSRLPATYESRFEVYRAQLALAKHDSKRARGKLQRAIDADPGNGEALLTLATLLRDQNRAEQALLYYVRAEALPRYRERSRLGRAQLEIDRQNYPEALRLLRQVAQANPSRSEILGNIQSLENLIRNQT